MKKNLLRAILLLAPMLLPFSHTAHAERADRDKPIQLEADRVSVDDIKRVQVYEGHVVLSQGTLLIKADRIVVIQDADGFHKGVATGGPDGLSQFRQKRDDADDYMEGHAERIEHDMREEKTEFFKRAWIKNGQDEVEGSYISYDGLTEKYLVSSGLAADGRTPVSAPGERVSATIRPGANKGKTNPPPSPAPAPAAPAKLPRIPFPLAPPAAVPGTSPSSPETP
ncbi:MAG: lipopolysaccharide transport periplasmic protein LptA [Betaproteobacteria bacterium]|nr:lipopolysaccharide transport periplasmic protein LptA [Betaproteobacteria bacterium]